MVALKPKKGRSNKWVNFISEGKPVSKQVVLIVKKWTLATQLKLCNNPKPYFPSFPCIHWVALVFHVSCHEFFLRAPTPQPPFAVSKHTWPYFALIDSFIYLFDRTPNDVCLPVVVTLVIWCASTKAHFSHSNIMLCFTKVFSAKDQWRVG